MTTADAFREFNDGIQRARRAYYAMTTCVCGAPVDPAINRHRRTCDACKRAKPVRKAAAQKRYRDRTKK